MKEIQRRLFKEPKLRKPKPLKPIPTYHTNDAKYKLHCVDCEILLIVFDVDEDYDHNKRDKILKCEDHSIIFKGKRCKKCTEVLEDYVMKYYNRRKKSGT